MGKIYIVRKGHTFHINPSKYKKEGETFVAEESEIKGQEYKLDCFKSVDQIEKEDRAIKMADNRGL